MLLRQLDLTTALRPSLLPDETLLFVQDGVGLYEGKYKIPDHQNGHAYLTSHRACYVDNTEPRKHSVAVDLKDVERPEFYAGFLKSSPKVTLHPKPSHRASWSPRPAIGTSPARGSPNLTPPIRHGSPLRTLTPAPPSPVSVNATWVCPICSFSNPVPANFDPTTANAYTPLPPCLTCGIKPPLVHVVKAAVAARASRTTSPAVTVSQSLPSAPRDVDLRVAGEGGQVGADSGFSFQCPRCTFENHPSLLVCEMCGASLVSGSEQRLDGGGYELDRSESPAPLLSAGPMVDDVVESIKFSFRAGGEKVFFERLKGALVQRKWILQSAPPIPKTSDSQSQTGSSYESSRTAPDNLPYRTKAVGIAGLERRGLELRKNNELVIGSAFEDLSALMTSAKEVIALAETFASQSNLSSSTNSPETADLLQRSASALGLVTTKDMLASSNTRTTQLYHSELARHLAELLTDDVTGVLRREGGIISLVDLWALFNRARGGVELVAPADFAKAAQLWEELKLPVRLRRFKSGLLVVQGRDRTDDKTIAALRAWLGGLRKEDPDADATWDWRRYGRGVTVTETAERFGWSIGVAGEELEMAEEKGALCREVTLGGLRFWENWLVTDPEVDGVG